MDSQLNEAVQSLQDTALRLGDRGILVTRHSAQDFTLELHPSVPFGFTQERLNW